MSNTSDVVFYVTVFPSQADGGGKIEVTQRILGMSYEDDEKKADKLTLQVDNYDLSNLDAPIWKAGNKLEVSWGYRGNMAPPRTCVIQKVTGSLVLSVEANDPSILMNKEQRIRTWENMKRSDIAQTLAEENGYDLDRIFVQDTEEVLPQVTQARMTDAQLLRDMAQREGFEFFVDFDGLHFHKRKLDQPAIREFIWFNDRRDGGDILSWNIENDLYARKAGGMTAAAKDPLTKKPFEVKGNNDAAAKEPKLAPVKAILEISAKDGTKTGYRYDMAKGSSAVSRSNEVTKKSAERAVVGAYTKNQMNAVELTMECRGDPAMIAKIVVTVSNIGQTVSGNYYVTSVNHKIMPGYSMTMKLKSDGKSAAGNAAAYGEAAGNGGGGGKGVKASGSVNNEPFTPPPGFGTGALIQRLSADGKPLVRIDRRDGSFVHKDSGGRANPTQDSSMKSQQAARRVRTWANPDGDP